MARVGYLGYRVLARRRRVGAREVPAIDRQPRLADGTGKGDLFHRKLRLVERERLLTRRADDLDHFLGYEVTGLRGYVATPKPRNLVTLIPASTAWSLRLRSSSRLPALR